MDHDHRISRRAALGAFGTVSLGALLTACGSDDARVQTTEGGTAAVEPKATADPSLADLFEDAKACRLTAEQTEGPFYFDVDSIRRDIREDREGTRLRLALRVRDAESCEPVENAVVDVWHCDADGLYSGFESASMGGSGGGRSDGATYLRGAQVTNAEGIAEFVTIYPGSYPGRTTHIHFKVHIDRSTVLTSQLFFEDELNAEVYAREPYAAKGGREVSNDSDGLFDPSIVVDGREAGEGVLALLNVDVARA